MQGRAVALVLDKVPEYQPGQQPVLPGEHPRGGAIRPRLRPDGGRGGSIPPLRGGAIDLELDFRLRIERDFREFAAQPFQDQGAEAAGDPVAEELVGNAAENDPVGMHLIQAQGGQPGRGVLGVQPILDPGLAVVPPGFRHTWHDRIPCG